MNIFITQTELYAAAVDDGKLANDHKPYGIVKRVVDAIDLCGSYNQCLAATDCHPIVRSKPNAS